MERERELLALDGALEATSRGAGSVTLIEGAPGLGKSALLAEVAARAHEREMTVLRARALTTESEYGFSVVLALFERVLTGASEPERARLFDGAAGLARPLLDERRTDVRGEEPAAGLFPRVHGLYWLAVNLAARGPALVCVDDLHWSDEPSLRFLLYLAARVEGLPVAVVLTARPPGSDGDSESLRELRASSAAARLSLAPIRADGVLALLRATIPDAREELAAACTEVTRGNPFYVREVLRIVAEEGIGTGEQAADTLRGLAGAAIARAALFRLVRAGADAVALGRALAILGDDVPLRIVAALAELELAAAAAAADALAGADVLTASEPVAFAHPLIRDQVYGEIGVQQRGLAHARAAWILAAEHASPERVAAQLLLAPGSGDRWATERLREAALIARASGDQDAAARLLRRALQEPPPSELRAELLFELGRALLAAGDADRAVQALTEALDLSAGSRARAPVRRQLAAALLARGDATAAAEALELAIADAGGEDAELSVELVADYLGASVFEPDLRQRAFTSVAPLLSGTPSGSTAAQRRLLAAMAMRSAQDAAPADRVIELAGTAWADGALLADDGPDGTAWLMVVWALELAEDYARARSVTSAVIEAARRSGSVNAFANASYYRGDSCYREGRLLDAQADAEQAIQAGGSGWRRYVVGGLVLKANVLIERDQLQEAAETLNAAEAHERSNMIDVAWLLHARGRLALAQSRPAQALVDLENAGRWLSERLGVTHTVLPWRADAALAALMVGDRGRARELIEPTLEAAERAGTTAMWGRRLRVLGLIEGGDDGLDLLRRGVDCLQRSQAALDHAQALADLGAALRRAGRRSDCRPVLQHALDRAHRLGAQRLEVRVRDELAVLGLRPRRAHMTGAGSLTPSERRVAQLAADGMSNPQIAQALFVTPKTVEFHLRHVYGKLGISGRTGLRAALADGEPSAAERRADGEQAGAEHEADGPAVPAGNR